MNCVHDNPPGYGFCGKCGAELEPLRCRCGFATAGGDLYCGRCGADLAAEAAPVQHGGADAEHRMDLEYVVRQAAQENQFLETTHKARVTQDDIRKLLSVRKKRF